MAEAGWLSVPCRTLVGKRPTAGGRVASGNYRFRLTPDAQGCIRQRTQTTQSGNSWPRQLSAAKADACCLCLAHQSAGARGRR